MGWRLLDDGVRGVDHEDPASLGAADTLDKDAPAAIDARQTPPAGEHRNGPAAAIADRYFK